MSVVKATLNDLDSITEVFNLYRLFQKQESDVDGARAFIKERLTNEESVIFIAFDGHDPIGIAQLFPSFSSVSMQRIWVLNDLYVKENVRGNGFGEKLIRKSIAFAEETDAKGLLLETADDNVKAQKLYKRIGFMRETNHFYFFSV